ncbi:MAG: hypothetical protein JWQ49_5914 [Edaphobacter sp.]|nr:hypothetical protein [Edaphobacter sp.]
MAHQNEFNASDLLIIYEELLNLLQEHGLKIRQIMDARVKDRTRGSLCKSEESKVVREFLTKVERNGAFCWLSCWRERQITAYDFPNCRRWWMESPGGDSPRRFAIWSETAFISRNLS